MPASTYTPYPAPTSGSGTPYGRVPGPIGLPDPFGDLSNVYPGLKKTNRALSGDIFSGLQGELSPGTLAQLQDFNAAWGAQSGMPGSRFVTNRLGRNIGLTAEDIKNKAIGQYNQTIPTISGTQTVSPALKTNIAETNALNAAAPDPAAAASHAEQIFQKYLQGLAGPGGGIRMAGGYGGAGFGSGFSYNPSAGPAAADSMGEVVGGALGGGAAPNTADPFAGWQMSYGDAAAPGAGDFYAGTAEGYDSTDPFGDY